MSFTVGRGETVALVGESGSGKSVTALSTVSLLGESAIVEGSVLYDGQEMIGASEKRRNSLTAWSPNTCGVPVSIITTPSSL